MTMPAMLIQFIRGSVFGRAVYLLSGRKWFAYKEEHPDYVAPDKYLCAETDEKHEDHIFVTWDGEDDPDSPWNWGISYKVLYSIQIASLTLALYCGAAMYLTGIEDMMEELHCSHTVAVLPMTLFIFGYGLGPAVFSPMSENASLGRVPIYVATSYMAFVLLIPTMVVKDIASICVLRFLTGLFVSPVVATGAASFADMFSPPYMPVGLAIWAWAGFSSVSMGGVLGSALYIAGGWRWAFYFFSILMGCISVFLTVFMPETYEKTLLTWKAQRLRRLIGNPRIVSLGETEHSHLTTRQLAIDTLWRPFEIMIREPVVLLIDVYLALVYAVLYVWFEAFPIVFTDVYHFTVMETGAAYLTTAIGVFVGSLGYMVYVYHNFTKRLLNKEPLYPELFLPLAIVGAVLMPIGLFVFGWTAAKDIHWMGPMMGAGIFGASCFLTFQPLLNYLGMSFPRYIASVFAGAALSRSFIAGAFPLFGRALFNNLATSRFQVGWGSSIIGFISTVMIGVLVVFYVMGEKLRATSHFSG